MKRNARRLPLHPFQAWADWAWKMGEMSTAAAQVIAHRSARMAAAGPLPDACDRREFTRMGQEKIDAATESALAMAGHLGGMSLQFTARAFNDMVTGTAALMSLGTSRNVGEFVTRQAKLAKALSRSAKTASDLSHSTTRLAGLGLAPIHARATANARRLRRR